MRPGLWLRFANSRYNQQYRLTTPAGTHSGWPRPFNWPGNSMTFV